MTLVSDPFPSLQYYLPNLNGTEKHPPKWKLEYLTFKPSMLHPPAGSSIAGADSDTAIDATEAPGFAYPIPLRHLPKSLQNVTAATLGKNNKFAPYKMADLTVDAWGKLAKKLAKPKGEKLRKRFREYMYMGAGQEL